MKGKYRIVVSNNKLNYTLEIERNITVISGNSGTGKTTLVSLLESYQKYGSQSGVSVQCQRPCVVIDSLYWESNIQNTHNSIVFIDEGNSFVETREFADLIKSTDNYYVLITRESLPQLPYSVSSILEMKKTTSRFKKTYNRTYPYYDNLPESFQNNSAELVVTEDSKSGFQMYGHICKKYSKKCISANGKSNITNILQKCKNHSVLVIADGAAFGPEIEKIYIKMQEPASKVSLYLPESFEWIILKSGIVSYRNLDDILDNPSEYIECAEYFSWEKYFTELLQKITQDTELQYNKNMLSGAYFSEKNVDKIIAVMIKNSY
ncbi:MAG: hypothetical protein ACI4KB_09455 [Oscillospiraceae bacterium]